MSVDVAGKVNHNKYAGDKAPPFIVSGKMSCAVHDRADVPDDVRIAGRVD